MTQQIINIGATPDDGDGDNLRTAFNKVNENFSNVWAQGPVDSNIRIQGNIISTLQVNQDLALSPNGVGNVRLNNNTIPGANNTWFLGSTTNRWRGLFVGNVTAGNVTINDGLTVPGDAYIGGNLTVVGNTIQIGNITTDTKTIQLANTALTDGAANGAGITVGANDDIATFLYESGNNVWTTNIGLQVGGPITGTSIAVSDATIYGNVDAVNGNFTGNVTANYFIGDGSQLTGIETGVTISNTAPALGNGGVWWNSVDGRAYVKYNSQFIDLSPSLIPDPTTYVGNVVFDDLTIENVGNILPATTNAYSLGSAGFQWKDLWVSNSTIYMNSVPIGLTSANVLTVNGEPILSNNSTTSITTTGNITADYLFGNGSQLTGLNTNRILNGTSNVEIATADGNVTVTANGSSTWTFDTTGNLITPANLVIGPSPAGGSSILQYDSALQVVGEGANAIMVMGWAANTNAPDSIAVVGFNTPYTNGASNVLIAVGNNATTVNYWNFDDTGNLSLPANGIISDTANGIGLTVENPPTTIDIIGADFVAVNLTYTRDLGEATPTWIPAGYTPGVDPYIEFSGGEYGIFVPGFGQALYVNTGTITAPLAQWNINPPLGSVPPTGVYTYSNPEWTFDATGNLTIPGTLIVTTGIVGSGASPAPSINGFLDASFIGNVTADYFIGDGSQLTGLPAGYTDSDVANLLANFGSNSISTTGNIDSGNISTTYIYGDTTEANVFQGGSANIAGNIIAGNFVGSGANVDIVAGSYDWTFVNDGNLVLPGNTFAVKYANGVAVSLGGNYSDSNVVSLLGAFGSNTITTTGNISAGYFVGNGSLLTGVANSAFTTVSANGTSLVADSASDTVTFTPGNNLVITGTAGTDTVTFAVNDAPTFTGNVTAQNFIGNITITGNVTGTSANVDIVAGSYQWTFNNAGNLVLPGNTFTVNYANGTAVSLGGGGGGTPGGSDTQVQFNDGGSFGGDSGFTYNKTTDALSVTGNITGANLTTAGNVAFTANSGAIAFNTGAYISGNGAPISREGSIVLSPYTGAGSTFPGVVIGGAGRLIAPNGGVFQIFNAADVTFQVATKITAGTAATSTTSGALQVTGGAGITGNIYAGGNISAVGNTTTGIGAVVAGPTNTLLANTVAGFTGNVNNYTQVTFQNKNTGADATADFILTADNGNDSTNYGDFGIINSGYDPNTPTNSLGNIVYAADTYVYAQGNISNTSQAGGNLVIGVTTPTKAVKIFAGGVDNNYLVANISNTGVAVTGAVSATGNVTGNYFLGNISQATGGYGNANVVANLAALGTNPIVSNANISGATLYSTNASGDEGGEIQLTKPPNGTLSGGITIDAYQNRFRVFEQGGTARGMYIDLANSPAGVGAAIGYRDIPQVSLAANTTITTSDAGKHYYSTSASALTLTIANNASQGFQIGATLNIINQGAGNVSVLRGVGVTMYLAGNSTSSDRTLTSYGVASITKVSTDTWFISGVGLI